MKRKIEKKNEKGQKFFVCFFFSILLNSNLIFLFYRVNRIDGDIQICILSSGLKFFPLSLTRKNQSKHVYNIPYTLAESCKYLCNLDHFLH